MNAAKRLVVCCDGTWNRADQRSPTNVVRFAEAVPAVASDGAAQQVYYQPGVGTRPGERLFGGAFGRGLARHVRDAYRVVAENFAPGDELWLFGFSRGAFTARSTAGFIRNCGVLRPEHIDRLDEAYELYRDRGSPPWSAEAQAFRTAYAYETPIRFIGVWDTVGALGVPGRLLSFLNRNTRFHDTELSSWVQAAAQALAVDERRRPFRPTIWSNPPAPGQVVEQLWYAGVHSDVGGGCPEDDLSDVTLGWMADRAREHGLTVGDLGPGDPLGPLHESYRGFYRLVPPRRRTIGATAPATERIAGTVDERIAADPDYRPANVADFRDRSDAPQ